jgi:site-specific DNA recombinase
MMKEILHMVEEKTIKRCAVYTRVSIEASEPEFNSLDAQRESAENYIKSQKENGWVILPEHYDDDGYSGGNTERPALKRLLADVEAGKIDIILLYKMDRLSRSLLDFMKLTEMLEQHNVSFVSVTQDINTSTSSGRMMLNILMTFSEFERAVIADRVRDRIESAKRRGKYCGGPPLLGYDADPNKKLQINKKEAKIVREAFTLYSRYGSAMETARILNECGYRTKDWTSKKGRRHREQEFTADAVYRMLNNPLYLGQVHHRGQLFPGEHEAIVDQKLWDKVRELLRANAPIEAGFKKNSIASPFKGLLRCGHCGGAFGIAYAHKKQDNCRRYMYYICMKDEDRIERQCPLRRVPAGDIDRVIMEQIARIFKTPSMLTKTFNYLTGVENERRKNLLARKKELETELGDIRAKLKTGGDVEELRRQFTAVAQNLDAAERELKELGKNFSPRELMDACGSIETIWEELFPAERYKLAHILIDKITLYTDHLVMDIKTYGLKSLIKELNAGESVKVSGKNKSDKGLVQLTVPLVIRRRHGRKTILAPDETAGTSVAGKHGLSALALHLARAHAWMETLESGKADTIVQLAEKLGVDRSYVSRTLGLLNLSPELQRMVFEGREPEALSLTRLRGSFPDDWDEQKKMFLPQPVQ